MIGIIAAMEEEMALFKEAFDCEEDRVCGISFYLGNYQNQDIVVALSGVGKVHAAMAATLLIEHFQCERIIHTGIAGGLCGVHSENIVIGTKLCYVDVDVTPFGYAKGQIPGMPPIYRADMESIVLVKQILKRLGYEYVEGAIYTSDTFVTNLNLFKDIKLDEPSVCEMEGTAVAQVCTKCGIPFIVLRYVSDVVGDENQISDYQNFEKRMAQRSCEICLKIITNFE